MRSRIYSFKFFILLSLCSIFVITLICYDHEQINVFIWIIIPLIMLLFSIEYQQICKYFECTVCNLTACDFVYVCSICSLIVELLRINLYYDDYAVSYWQRKALDAFLNFITFIRVIHAVLRAVLYYICSKGKASKRMKHKAGYEATALNEDGVSIQASSVSISSDESQENEPPEPIQPAAKKYIEIMDDDDDTAPLPNCEQQTIPKLSAGRNSVNLQDDFDCNTPKETLKLNMKNILSPPQIDVEPSDVDTHSVERLELIQTFTPAQIEPAQSVQSDDDDASDANIIISKALEKGKESWGIFLVFVSETGIISSFAMAIMTLFDDMHLFFVQICIFLSFFVIFVYLSAQSMVQFTKSYEGNQSAVMNELKELNDEQISNEFLNASKAKQSLHEILEEFANDGRRSTNISKMMTNNKTKTIEFRTGADDIKCIVRNLLNQTAIACDTKEKLQNILQIVSDFDIMNKGNIEEQIENDENLDDEVKQWLFEKVTAHETPKNYLSTATPNNFKITPRFSFNDSHQNMAVPNLITPVMSDDFDVVSPQKLNVLLSPPSIKEEEEEETEEKKEKNDEVNILHIIQTNLNNNDLLSTLQSISPQIDEYTQQILKLDGRLNTIELNQLIGRPLLHSAVCLCLKFRFDVELSLNFEKFVAFIACMEENYHSSNPYHNNMHATEVMMASMMFLDCLQNDVKSMLSTLQLFAAFIAAICHDVGV